jgi:hypothetical protein
VFISHWALGIGHWALVISSSAPPASLSPLSPLSPHLPISPPPHLPHPLTAPAVRPWTIRRWKNKTNITRGNVPTTVAAAIAP